MEAGFRAIRWENGRLILLDQTKLPAEEYYLECKDYRTVGDAIRRLAVRGAPAIGVAAAFGVVLGAKEILARNGELLTELPQVFKDLSETRPTAVNLFWALNRMERVFRENRDMRGEDLVSLLEQEALLMYREDEEGNRRLGEYGAQLLSDGMTVLTICNTGTLATVAFGTALAVIRMAVAGGKRLSVIACETRPLLQGARLTAWELMRDGIPVTLITDSMAGFVMQKKMVQAVIAGADRIAANGDVVNKIGTYTLAVLAKHHGIPFYVAAPLSTVDLSTSEGTAVPIEERGEEEVCCLQGVRIAPEGVSVFNPAFDITPSHLVTGVITEKGVITQGRWDKLQELKRGG